MEVSKPVTRFVQNTTQLTFACDMQKSSAYLARCTGSVHLSLQEYSKSRFNMLYDHYYICNNKDVFVLFSLELFAVALFSTCKPHSISPKI